MHDTKLHTEPEEFVFVRRSHPLTGFVPDTTGVQVNGLNLFNPETGKKVFDRIIVRPSSERAVDGEKIDILTRDPYPPISLREFDSFERWKQLSDGPRAKNKFDD